MSDFGMAAGVGSFCWNELATTDTEGAARFYGALFGWAAESRDMGAMGTYITFLQENGMVGGMMKMTPEWGKIPPHWMAYVAVADCDATARRAQELGGKVCVPPMDIPGVGRFAVITDPQGATVSILRLKAPGEEEKPPTGGCGCGCSCGG